MAPKSSDNILDTGALWAKGINLTEALEHFCSPRLRRESIELPVYSAETIKSPTIKTVLEPWNEYFSGKVAIGSERVEQVLSKINKGVLIGVGYSLPRKPQDPPVLIPLDLWRRKNVQWHKNAIKGSGLEFTAVRLVSLLKVNKLSTRDLIIPEIRKVGRPLIKPTIRQAIIDLKKANKLNGTSVKLNQNIIRERTNQILERVSDGPKIEVIRQVKRDYFDKNWNLRNL